MFGVSLDDSEAESKTGSRLENEKAGQVLQKKPAGLFALLAAAIRRAAAVRPTPLSCKLSVGWNPSPNHLDSCTLVEPGPVRLREQWLPVTELLLIGNDECDS